MELEQALFNRECVLASVDKLLVEVYSDREFKIRYRSLEPAKKEFLSTQKTIEKLMIKAKIFEAQVQAKFRSDFEEKYYKIQTIFHERFPARDESRLNSTTIGDRSTDTKPNVRLPKLSLPEFNGEYTSWGTFRDLFQSLIHDNSSLTNIEKFQYLLLSLREQPRRLIQSIPITDTQYPLAWECLKNRFENPRCISSKHVESLLDLPHLAKNATAQQIKQFTTLVSEQLGALRNMKINVDGWDYLLFHILQRKLDVSIRQQFENKLDDPKEIPTLQQLLAFLERLSVTLENCQPCTYTAEGASETKTHGRRSAPPPPPPPPQPPARPARTFMTLPYDVCGFCRDQAHHISQCSEFLQLGSVERFRYIKEKKYCVNCLSTQHTLVTCKSTSKCKICNKRHNTLLHFFMKSEDEGASNCASADDAAPRPASPHSRATEAAAARGRTDSHSAVAPTLLTSVPAPSPPFSTSSGSGGDGEDTCGVVSLINNKITTNVLFFTALVKISDCNSDSKCYARAIIDTASERTFITENLAQRLRLSRSRANIPICGLGNSQVDRARGRVGIAIEPHFNSSTKLVVEALVVPIISGNLPASTVPVASSWSHLQNLQLADPKYYKSQAIDLLIGADYYSDIILGDRVAGPPGTPIAVNSTLGYLLIGKINNAPADNSHCFLSINSTLNQTLLKFWEIEEIPAAVTLNAEDAECENKFRKDHFRNTSGRYTVRLPFREEPPTALGDSREAALRRFAHLERRLTKDTHLASEYNACLQEYIDAGHMELAPDPPRYASQSYYLPHHCVLKRDSLTTKLRTVFDASMKTDSGKSLNDILLTGPTLQRDIVAIISNFRLHKIAFTADIKQMYRQIAIHGDDRDWQRILWREGGAAGGGALREYHLCTVTFGVSSSPYLALRTLQQLADDDGERYPRAARVLRHDVFMDDVVSGADSVPEALDVQRELIELCLGGGFPLRKWTSNAVELLSDLPDGDKVACISFDDDQNAKVKVLGLEWNPRTDCFSYRVRPSLAHNFTKRTILSEISRIYDPMGWLAPVIILVKILIQTLWTMGVEWDDPLPQAINDTFYRFLSEAPQLADIRIPRYIMSFELVDIQIHGFCDSSQAAYSGVVYLRTQRSDGSVEVRLVMAKSKVAPLKSLSIPRLELCGALLLSRLVDYVKKNYKDKISLDSVFAWSDSSVVLSWLRSSPHNWKTFVANRVAEIPDKIPPDQWRHIGTADNPADCASRGIYPSQLADHALWWAACRWLTLPQTEWPVSQHEWLASAAAAPMPSTSTATATVANHAVFFTDVNAADLERRTQVMATFVSSNSFLEELLNKYSSLGRLQRITALIFRFSNNCKTKSRANNPITLAELNQALVFWIKYVQNESFSDDIGNLKNDRSCSVRLQRLSPFIDSKELVRVGGRIRHSDATFEAKHPIVLPKRSPLTVLIIDDMHVKYLHPGAQTLQAIIVQRYWILSARSIIRERTHNCMTCFRHKPSFVQPRMADLPAYRIKRLRGFQRVGVDYAGPYMLKASKIRNAKSYKAYLCLFICLCTKAVHLELVTDLTADAFIAALRRFAGRRSAPSDISSDNGTCFVRANKMLKEWYTFLQAPQTQTSIVQACNGLGITWHFNPSLAPHFGGIWESNIKGTKHHLSRSVGSHALTFEEFSTLLCQVEAVLNSRPLHALSNDANDEEALTPGHFIVGQALTSPPDRDLSFANVNTLTRWNLIQHCVRQFWRKWHLSYLNTLQQRNKWSKSSYADVSVGRLVILKEDNSPPLAWKLGRIVDTHPCEDGFVRVVSVRAQGRTFKRPLVKVAPLPIAPEPGTPCL